MRSKIGFFESLRLWKGITCLPPHRYPSRGRTYFRSFPTPISRDNNGMAMVLAILLIFAIVLLFMFFARYILGIDIFSWLNQIFKTIMYRLPI